MKKSIVLPIITILLEVIATYAVAQVFSVRFIEVMFFVGLLFTVVICTFSSKGGSFTRFMDSSVSAQTGYILESEPFFHKFNKPLLVSIIYTIIGLVFFILLIKQIIPPAS
ncbi:hypothetical protein [Niallia sp. 03133]|uniref:hypothetical protein n=1 Tax=Niallia sp. 03133 TaxID=3458060 RepID=UPI00404424A6